MDASSPRLSLRRERWAAQFRGLDLREPGRWPALPRLAAWVAAGLTVLVLGWVTVLADSYARLQAEHEREAVLRASYRDKLSQAVNLAALRQQKQQVQQRVQALERQLPGRAEMEALLSDVTGAARDRGLTVEVFRPGPLQLRDHHAELPITLRLSGRYHDIGAFAADIARLPRIIALRDLQLTVSPSAAPEAGPATARATAAATKAEPAPSPTPVRLTLEATALTYRALEPAEAAEQQRRRQAEKAARAAQGARK